MIHRRIRNLFIAFAVLGVAAASSGLAQAVPYWP